MLGEKHRLWPQLGLLLFVLMQAWCLAEGFDSSCFTPDTAARFWDSRPEGSVVRLGFDGDVGCDVVHARLVPATPRTSHAESLCTTHV